VSSITTIESSASTASAISLETPGNQERKSSIRAPLSRFSNSALTGTRVPRNTQAGLDEGLVSRDDRTIREKSETEPKIGKWFQDLTRLSI
jgi:hypothetical protein